MPARLCQHQGGQLLKHVTLPWTIEAYFRKFSHISHHISYFIFIFIFGKMAQQFRERLEFV